MTAHVRVGGVWRTLDPKFRVGGVWKTATGGWVKVGGVWRKFYPDIITPTVVIAGSLYNTDTGVKTISGIAVNAGDYIVALAASTGTTSGGAVSDNVFGAYSQSVNAVFTGASARQCGIYAQVASASTTINVSFTPGIAETGGGLTVVVLQGGAGTQGIYLTGNSDTVVSGTPSCELSGTPAANDVVLGIATGQSIPTLGSGFATAGSGSWVTPTNGVHAQYKNGGASSTVAWGGSVTTHCCAAVAYKPQ